MKLMTIRRPQPEGSRSAAREALRYNEISGAVTPKEADLQQGKLPQHAVVLVRTSGAPSPLPSLSVREPSALSLLQVRTSRYLAAARALSVPPRKLSEI